MATKTEINGKLGSDGPIKVASAASGDEDAMKRPSDTMVSVRVTYTESDIVFTLDGFDGDSVENARFVTRTYGMTPSEGSLGVFAMIDDFFTRRYRLLQSSKSCQSFMMALVKAEKKFKKRTKMDLYEYCGKITGRVLEHMTNDEDVGGAARIHEGYSIIKDAEDFNLMRFEGLDLELMCKLASDIAEEFDKYLDYAENRHFAGLIVSKIDDIPPSFCSDPTTGGVLIAYIPEFAQLLMVKTAHSMFSQDVFKMAGIDRMGVDIFLVMPETTFDDIDSMMVEDNEIVDYEHIEDRDFITARYKSYTITVGEIDESKFDSFIAY